MAYYHYTCVEHLESIIRDGRIRPTESNVSIYRDHAGPDVVWLLDLPTPEGGHGIETKHNLYDKAAVRIEVGVPAIRWLDWAPARTMDSRWKGILIESGGGPEMAEHWYVWPAAITSKHWHSITVHGEYYIPQEY